MKEQIIKSSIGIIFITLCAKVLGYIEKLVLAYYFGTNYNVDVYTVIFTIIFSIFIFFREIIEPGFLNIFIKLQNDGKEKQAWSLFRMVFIWTLFITLLISIGTFFYSDSIISWFAPGFTGEKKNIAINLLKIAAPACMFLSLTALTNITLNALKQFSFPAAGDLIFKGGIVLTLVLMYKYCGIYACAWGVLIGALAKLLMHLGKLYRRLSFDKNLVNQSHLKDLWILTWPLLIGITFSQLSSIIDNMFASQLQEGSIAALSYSKKIIELPILIFPYVISVVIFPYFSQLVIEKEKEKLSSLLFETLKWIVIIFFPLSIYFLVHSTEIVEIIFQRGAFDKYSTLLTAQPLYIYSFGMVIFAIETVLVIFYFAYHDTKTPIFLGIACVILNIFLTYYFIQIIDYSGIAIALVISKSVKVFLLLFLLRYKMTISLKGTIKFMGKIIFSAFWFSALIIIIKIYLYNEFASSIISKLFILSLSFFIGSVVYFLIVKSLVLKKEVINLNLKETAINNF